MQRSKWNSSLPLQRSLPSIPVSILLSIPIYMPKQMAGCVHRDLHKLDHVILIFKVTCIAFSEK